MAGLSTDTVTATFEITLADGRLVILTIDSDGVEDTVTARLGDETLSVRPHRVVHVNGTTDVAGEACDVMTGGGDYCIECGWHAEAHGDFPCCADWCGLHVSHNGPCKEY